MTAVFVHFYSFIIICSFLWAFTFPCQNEIVYLRLISISFTSHKNGSSYSSIAIRNNKELVFFYLFFAVFQLDVERWTLNVKQWTAHSSLPFTVHSTFIIYTDQVMGSEGSMDSCGTDLSSFQFDFQLVCCSCMSSPSSFKLNCAVLTSG